MGDLGQELRAAARHLGCRAPPLQVSSACRELGRVWAPPVQTPTLFFALTECGESLEGQEHPNLGDGNQHLNTSCYPSTCITDVLLSYKHPEVPFGMEQAGV